MHPISDAKLHRIYVWDLPVRIVHWGLLLFVLLSWVSAEYEFKSIHIFSGYVILGLVLFRLYWGLFGSSTARFSNFVRGPGTTSKYALQLFRRPGMVSAGHNPLGALSVVTILSLLLLQTSLGLFARDVDGSGSGPLSPLISYGAGRFCAELHHVIFELLLIILFLHIAAVAFYVFYKKDSIVSAMINGFKHLPETPAASLKFQSLRRALFGAAAISMVLAIVYLVSAEL